MKTYRWMIAVAVLCAALLSCGEVLNEYYISNHTAEPLSVELAPIYIENADLTYGPLIAEIRTSERERLGQPLEHQRIGERLLFTIPPYSSVYLGFSFGGNTLISSLEIHSERQQVVMDEDDYRDYFEVYDRFFGAIVQVYNVK